MNKLKILWLTAFVLAISGSAFAGKIFGDIKLGDKPIAEGMRVTITLPVSAVIADSAKTDKFGAYALKVKGEGKCTLTLYWEKQVLSLEAISYANATSYNLILEKKDNKYILKRK